MNSACSSNRHFVVFGLAFIFLFVLNIFLLFNSFTSKRIEGSELSAAAVTDSVRQAEGERMTRYLLMSLDLLQNNGLVLNDCRIINIESHDTVNGTSFFMNDNDHLLVCRISQYDCEECCSYALEKSIEFINDNNTNLHMVVFGQYNDDRTLRIYSDNHSHSKGLKYYNVNQLNIPVDEHGNPYYFVLDKNMTVSDVFTPDKMVPDLTDMYFQMINKKWN